MRWTSLNRIIKKFQANPRTRDNLRKQIIKKYLETNTDIKDISINKGCLEIKVNSSAALQEFFFKKEEIKNRINSHFKREVVKEVVVKRY